MIIIAINCFVIIVNFLNCFDQALTEIFQFCRALASSSLEYFVRLHVGDLTEDQGQPCNHCWFTETTKVKL